ncbi:hypothetical protein K458DRAFT_457511 [Lentithecium fluviatile CBS 122367]|uniref:Uncharacterized protein n=1 Tax=Lentithecium fluviatile CBS 122367 TaxID=1168545 RepID=A0A6G1ISK3_9PLEO|nr:hypothetical protein K458DRAFT_457511 [Lentithecium fluviatile CBS 122367]
MAHRLHQHSLRGQWRQRCTACGVQQRLHAGGPQRTPGPSPRPKPRRITCLYIYGSAVLLIHRRDTLAVANLASLPPRNLRPPRRRRTASALPQPAITLHPPTHTVCAWQQHHPCLIAQPWNISLCLTRYSVNRNRL